MTIVQFLIKLGPFIDVLTKLIQAGAIIIGGWWVWRNYFRGRTHVPRLQVELKAKELRAINGRYHLATMTVKNPGLSIVYITREGTGLSLGQLNAVTHVPEVFAPPWTSTDTFSVLENHESIEPGLTVKEQKLLMLPYQEGDVFFPGIPSCCT